MPTPVKKIDLAPALKALTKSLEQTTTLVTSLKNGVGAEEFSQLQDKAKETASVLRDVGEELGGKPLAKAEPAPADKEGSGTRTLTAATAALEKLTSVVNALKSKTAMTPEEFAQVVKEIGDIANELSAVGERYPSPTAKAEDAAAAAAEPAVAPAVAAAAAEPAAAAAAPAAAEPVVTEPPAAAPAAAAPAEATAEEVAKNALALATAVDAAANGEISKTAFEGILKGLNDTMLRGGIMLDTSDLGVLRKVVEVLARVMGGDAAPDAMAKAESASRDFLRTCAATLRELGDVKEQAAVAKSLKTAALVHSVLQGVNEVLVSKVEAGRAQALAKKDDQAAITAAVAKAVADAVGPLQTSITKLNEDNAKLRTEIGKRDAEPVRRASSTDPIDPPAPAGDSGKLFPMNYNAPSLAD